MVSQERGGDGVNGRERTGTNNRRLELRENVQSGHGDTVEMIMPDAALKMASDLPARTPDVMVIGHASFTAINRNVYIRLAAEGFDIEMVIPRFVPYFEREADARRP